MVDEKADEHFKKEIQLLADCLPNVFVMVFVPIYNLLYENVVNPERWQNSLVQIWHCPCRLWLPSLFGRIEARVAIFSGGSLTKDFLDVRLFSI